MPRLTSLTAVAFLVLTLPSISSLSTRVAAADDSLHLEGTSWVLVMLEDHRPLPQPAVTMRFEKGRVSGSDGCNTYMADYGTSPVGFRLLSPTVSTRKACPPAIGQQADAFNAAVAKTRRLQRDGDHLHLMDGSGGVLATLGPAARTSGASTRETGRLFGGEMTYLADAATFSECASGLRYPVAMEGAFPQAERAYRETLRGPPASTHFTPPQPSVM